MTNPSGTTCTQPAITAAEAQRLLDNVRAPYPLLDAQGYPRTDKLDCCFGCGEWAPRHTADLGEGHTSNCPAVAQWRARKEARSAMASAAVRLAEALIAAEASRESMLDAVLHSIREEQIHMAARLTTLERERGLAPDAEDTPAP